MLTIFLAKGFALLRYHLERNRQISGMFNLPVAVGLTKSRINDPPLELD